MYIHIDNEHTVEIYAVYTVPRDYAHIYTYTITRTTFVTFTVKLGRFRPCVIWKTFFVSEWKVYIRIIEIFKGNWEWAFFWRGYVLSFGVWFLVFFCGRFNISNYPQFKNSPFTQYNIQWLLFGLKIRLLFAWQNLGRYFYLTFSIQIVLLLLCIFTYSKQTLFCGGKFTVVYLHS